MIYFVIALLLLFHFTFLSYSFSESKQIILNSAVDKIFGETEIRTIHPSLVASREMCGLQGPGVHLYNGAVLAHPLLQAPNVGMGVLLSNQPAVPAHATQSSFGFAMLCQKVNFQKCMVCIDMRLS